MIERIGGQIRFSGGMASSAVGLDYGAALMLGQAMEADMDLLADILPAAERALLSRFSEDSGTGFFDDEEIADGD